MDDASSRVIETAKRKLGLGDGEGAVLLLQNLVGRLPGEIEPHLVLGQVFLELGQSAEAVPILSAATVLDPTDPRLAAALGLALLREGFPEESYEALVGFASSSSATYEVLLNFSQTCFVLDRGEEGASAATRALALKPEASAPAINRFLCRRTSDDLGAWRELLETGLRQPGVSTLKVAAAESLYFSDLDESEVINVHREIARRLEGNIPATQRYSGTREAVRTLRIGFLSPDFRRHPVASFTLAVLKHWPIDEIAPVFFSLNPIEDDVTKEFEGIGPVRRCAGLKAPAIAAQVLADKVDILFDLAGYTVGSRPEILAMKPAPVVISGIGYPASLQFDRVTGELSDTAIRTASNEEWPRPLLLSTPLLCYSPVVSPPPIQADEVEDSGFRWGAACNAKKINAKTVELWTEVLRADPATSLTCVCPEFSRKSELCRVQNLFNTHEFGERISFVVGERDFVEYMKHYTLMDGVLDTFPFNGATTTLDALLMGVPVLTLAGSTQRSRVGMSLLRAMPAYVAATESEYVEKAVRHSRSGRRSAADRKELRSEVENSPVTDAAAYARTLADVLRQVWAGYCSA